MGTIHRLASVERRKTNSTIMNIFKWTGHNKVAEDSPKSIEETELPRTLPRTEPQNECFRVGYTTDGYVTLTLMATNGYSQTISMTPAACERMIRILRATYTQDDNDKNE